MAITYTQLQSSFRYDTGTVDATPSLVGANTNWRRGAIAAFRFRVVLQVSGTGTPATTTWPLKVQKNGAGGYVDLGGTTGIIASAIGSADQAGVTAQRLASGAGSWQNGFYSIDGIVDSCQIPVGFTEFEFGLALDLVNCAQGDYWDFRLYRGTTTALTYSGTTIRLAALKIAADAATPPTYALTGVATTALTKQSKTAPVAGSYALSISDQITVDNGLTVDTGSFTLTGIDADFRTTALKKIAPDVIDYSITGIAVGLGKSNALSVDAGSFALSISDIVTVDNGLSLDAGSFALSGVASTLKADHKLAAESGGFTLSGIDADIKKPSLGLAVEAGTYLADGSSGAGLIADHRTTPVAGSYSLTGFAITKPTTLPVTITGISTAVAPVGPFKSNAGNYYFFGIDATGSGYVDAMKAADPSSSFSQVAQNTIGNTNAKKSLAAYQVGDVIHLIAGVNVLATVYYYYCQFDMATDGFGTGEAVASALTTTGQTGALQYGCSIVVRSGGEVVAFFNGAQTKTGGTFRARVYYSRRTGTNTWSAPVEVDASAANDSTAPEAVLGASDRVHFFYTSSASAFFRHRSLSSSNAFDTEQTSSSGSAITQGISFNDSGTMRVNAVGSGFSSHFDSGASPTITQTVIQSSAAPYRPFVDGTTVYALYRLAADGDLYLRSSTNNGASWSAAANVFVGNIGSTETSLSVDGKIYQRGNWVLPYICNDNGTLKYNEAFIKSASIAANVGAYTLSGVAAEIRQVTTYRFSVSSGSYSLQISDQVAIGSTVPSDSGSYSLIGGAADLRKGTRKIAASLGSYNLVGAISINDISFVSSLGSYSSVGISSGLTHGRKITASARNYLLSGLPVMLTKVRTINAGAGSYALSGITAGFTHNRTIPALSGNYTKNGVPAGLLADRNISASGNSYFYEGTNAGLRKYPPESILANTGSYGLSGQSLAMRNGRAIAPSADSYSVTGVAAGIFAQRKLAASVGVHSVSGLSVALKRYKLAVNGSAYASSGLPIGLESSRHIAADSSSYSLSGKTANLRSGFSISALPANYTIANPTTALIYDRIFAPDGTDYNIGGSEAALKFYNITITVGSYSIDGKETALGIRSLLAETGGYILSGEDIAYHVTRNLSAETISYSFGGVETNISAARNLSSSGGSYAFSGSIAGLNYYNIYAGPSVYSLAGNGVAFRLNNLPGFLAESGSYTLSGQPVQRKLMMRAGSYILSGAEAGKKMHRVFPAITGPYIVTINGVGLKAANEKSIFAESVAFNISGMDARIAQVIPKGFICDLQASFKISSCAVAIRTGSIFVETKKSSIDLELECHRGISHVPVPAWKIAA